MQNMDCCIAIKYSCLRWIFRRWFCFHFVWSDSNKSSGKHFQRNKCFVSYKVFKIILDIIRIKSKKSILKHEKFSVFSFSLKNLRPNARSCSYVICTVAAVAAAVVIGDVVGVGVGGGWLIQNKCLPTSRPTNRLEWMIHAVCIAQEQTVNCSALTIYCCCCTVCMFCTSLARTWCRLTRAAQNVSMYCTNDIRVDRIPWNRIETRSTFTKKKKIYMSNMPYIVHMLDANIVVVIIIV